MDNNNISVKLPALLYDNKCVFCNRFALALKRLDKKKKINFVSIYDERIEKIKGLEGKEYHQIVHLIEADGKILKGPEVISYLLRSFPGISKFSWLIETNAAQKAMNVFYNKLSDIRRYGIGRCNSCR